MVDSHSCLRAVALTAGFSARNPVLADVNLELSAGTILGIAGPNGAGKSTLVKTLARQLKPLSGKVEIDGREIWSFTAAQFAATVAYVPQALDAPPDMTVEELVTMGRNPHQKWWQWYASAQDRQAIESALEATALVGLRKHYLTQLSGGERQRAAIATALAQQPQFMLMDEPTAHLDFSHQLDLLAQLRCLQEAKIGCIVVLHDLNLIARICDKVAILQERHDRASVIAACGATTEILTPALLADVFDVEVNIVQDPDSGTAIFYPSARSHRTR